MTAATVVRLPGRVNVVGTVYLLHFDRPYQHARHYIGWARDVEARLAAHAAGRGARLLEVAAAAGISWTLARTWQGTRTRERQIKNCGGASRCCPLCGVRPRPDRARVLSDSDRVACRLRELLDQAWCCQDGAERARIDAEIEALMGPDEDMAVAA